MVANGSKCYFFSVHVYVTGSKLMKECRNRSENLINRKITKFCNTPKKFSVRKKFWIFSEMCQHFVTLSYGDSLYTHCQESGNDTFQNMLKIFTGLENVFAGPGWVWKPHKSKDQIFLHRNYIQKYFSTPKKNMFFPDRKKIRKFFGHFSEKIRNFFFELEKTYFFSELKKKRV